MSRATPTLVDIEIPDQPVKGRILLDKKGLQFVGAKTETDAWGNEVQRPVFEERYLAGAVFEVRAAEEIVGTDGTVWYQQDELVDTVADYGERCGCHSRAAARQILLAGGCGSSWLCAG